MSQSHEYYPHHTSSKEYPTVYMSSSQEQTAGDSQYQDPASQFSNPLSPPPASAPPPPPPSESDAGSIQSVGLQDEDDSSSEGFPSLPTPPQMMGPRSSVTPPEPNKNSSSSSVSSSNSNYNYSSYQTTRAAAVPMITNYGVSPTQNYFPKEKSSSYQIPRTARGDTTIRPNTGQTNDEYGGLGSLREVTGRLRWMTIACTLTALVWEGFAFPARLLVHTWDHAAKVVLGGYLAFFCLLLLGVELNAPLRDLFGVLYHPLGRGFLLLVMSSMCYGIHIDWWELLLCVAFAACSLGYIYAFVKYPEYRRWQDYNDNQIWSDVRHAVQRRTLGQGSAYWADPSQRTTSRTWNETQRETQSLLHQV